MVRWVAPPPIDPASLDVQPCTVQLLCDDGSTPEQTVAEGCYEVAFPLDTEGLPNQVTNPSSPEFVLASLNLQDDVWHR